MELGVVILTDLEFLKLQALSSLSEKLLTALFYRNPEVQPKTFKEKQRFLKEIFI